MQVFNRHVSARGVTMFGMETILIPGSIVLAARMHGSVNTAVAGLWQIGLITALCELCFYYNDLYDLTIVHSTRELVIRVLQAWCLGQAFGLAVPLAAYFALIPIIVLVIQIPITVNGLGTAQVAFKYLFLPLGTPAPQVVAVSILFLALGVIGTLPGAALYLMDSPTVRSRI